MSARMSANGGLSGLVILTLSFVDPDPTRTSAGDSDIEIYGAPPSVRWGGGGRLRHALLELLFGHVVLPGWDDVDVVVVLVWYYAHRVFAPHDSLDLLQIQLPKF